MAIQAALSSSDIEKIDPQGMIDFVRGFPDQLREGRAIAEDVVLDVSAAEKRQLAVIGMGGSAIAGDLVRCFTLDRSRLPIQVVRNYSLPASIGQDAIVIASSFSGNTEETLAAFGEAIERRATVISIASGGKLLELSRARGLPHAQIPGGMSPRAALGYSLAVLLVFAHRMGVAVVPDDAWDEADERLRAQTNVYGDVTGSHLALDIARMLAGRFPFIYSAQGLLEAVGVRWRGQLQENGKKLAASNVYPELNHNEIMGWERTKGYSAAGSIGVVALRDREDHPRVRRRMDVTRSLLESRAGGWIEVASQGEHRLTRMVSLINLGDWVSLYTAYLRDVDPTPIGLIDELKEALGKTK